MNDETNEEAGSSGIDTGMGLFEAIESSLPHPEYGQPVSYEVSPRMLGDDASMQNLAGFDQSLRGAFHELGVPADSGRRILQIFAKNYGGGELDSIGRENLKRWLDDNPAVNQGAAPMLHALGNKFGSDGREVFETLGLGLAESKYVLAELALLAGDMGLSDE